MVKLGGTVLLSITKRRQDICYKVKRHRVMERKIENKRERQRGKRGKEMERKREGERKRRIGKEKERKKTEQQFNTE